MATPKSAPHAKRAAARRSHRKPKRTWNTYIARSLKAMNKQVSLSGRTMKIVNSYVNDVFERLATEAASIVRANKKRTLGARELQTAVRVVLPAELARHAMSEATKALSASTR